MLSIVNEIGPKLCRKLTLFRQAVEAKQMFDLLGSIFQLAPDTFCSYLEWFSTIFFLISVAIYARPILKIIARQSVQLSKKNSCGVWKTILEKKFIISVGNILKRSNAKHWADKSNKNVYFIKEVHPEWLFHFSCGSFAAGNDWLNCLCVSANSLQTDEKTSK